MKFQSLTIIMLLASTLLVSAQPFNAEITPEGKDPYLLGKINKDKLTSAPYSDWFVTNYDDYQPNTAVVNNFKETLKHYTITAFIGTWCGDSKREIPHFYKILDLAEYPMERLTLVAVSRDRDAYKQSPGGEEEGLTIHRVPTFIFYKDGKEINRIVESPVTTLEADIDAILKGAYASNYQTVAIVSQLLEEVPLEKFDKKAKKLLPKLKELATKVSELNTYSNVLFLSDRQEEAIAVAQLNTRLFPEESVAYSSLANKFYFIKKKEEALLYYEKALVLDPKNQELKVTITGLKQKEAH
ncbi:thiol-disulfide isomerase/thioredoxin [Ulvibacter sp. MAR_2010_11]|uniref:thioredoxin domain-containing protein n=1 Tax=Ulvibacter sp. MAR_2010_11 TaxID=1250229 RepID=UPI000C2CA7B4|nr:thioredoxin domain-containing protein [Ulvibacter sp. MAR_2010_11]PKA83398.1 thiol-disulfide isomerase/thioredoxin [Ulvibacter sp. MAR_2010_11]